MAKAVWTDTQVNAQLNSGYKLSGTNLTYGFPTNASWMPYSEATGFSQVTASQQNVAATAIKLWDDLIPVNFTLAADGNSATVKFSNTTTGISYAHAYYPGGWSGASSIWLNPAYNSGTNNLINPTPGIWGWGAIVHEAGHALGLNHPGTYNGGSPTYATDALYMQDSQQYTIMSYFKAANTGADWIAANGQEYFAQTPMIDDIMAIQAIYGVSTTTRTGNTTYGFNSNADVAVFDFTTNLNPIVAIFDSAGIDTIDVSGWSTTSLINLNPGTFSNANSMTSNISIARTAWIENATTGAGNDTLIGNTLANLLIGNGGNDSFTGGAGNDNIQGGLGTDTAIFSGLLSNYSITWSVAASAFTITDARGGTPDGIDTLSGIEFFAFTDQTVASSLYQTGGTAISIAATNAVLSEGNSGSTAFTFTLTRAGDLSQTGSVSYAVTGSGANAADAADFGGVLPSGVANFAAGAASTTVTVNVVGDGVVEANEGFIVTLSNPTGGATLGTATATGTIQNDDNPPSLAISATDAVKLEGDSGTTAFTFTVTRSGNISQAGTVNYAVTGSGANAAAAADFGGSLPAGAVSFAANQASATITVLVAGDTAVEADEGFAVTLSGASGGATITTASATGSILNNDSALAISANTATLAEGSSGGTTPFTFTVTRAGYTGAAASVNWSVSGGVDAADFGGAMPGGTVNFGIGQTSATISLNVAADSVVEGNESFTVSLSTPSGGLSPAGGTPGGTSGGTPGGNDGGFALRCQCPMCAQGPMAGRGTGDDDDDNAVGHVSWLADAPAPSGLVAITTASATATIVNDDASLSIAATSASQAEGTALTFTVTRTGDTSGAASANWTVTGAGGTPVDAADFGGTLPTGIVNFAAGQTSAVITVNVSGDSAVEADESLIVTLSNATGASIATASATGTVLNNDSAPIAPPPVITIAALNAAQTEGQAGTKAFTFTVTRDGDLTQASSANWAVSGAGVDAADFGGVLPTGIVSFGVGQASTTITVNVSGDAVVEGNESFTVTLSNPSGASLGTASAGGTILNDDASLAIAAANASLAEGNAGTTPFTFTVTRTGDTSGAASANWAVSGAAVSAADFGGVLPTGVVNFAAGETNATITVNVTGDVAPEADEAFTVTLTGATGASILTASAGGTILNEDVQTLFTGTAGDDVFNQAANTANLAFDLTQGGNDSATGGAGDDSFNLGASFNSTDAINGGDGTDSLNLDGNYASGVVLGAASLSNVERVNLAAGNSYNFTTNDANIAAGASLIFDASALASINTLNVNGAAETNGSITFLGGAGNDVFSGGSLNDTIRGGLGADSLNGRNGADIFAYGSAADSPLSFVATSITAAPTDQISNFATNDVIDVSAFVFGSGASWVNNIAITGFSTTAKTSFYGGAGVAVEYAKRGQTARLYVDVNKDNNLNSGDIMIQLTGVAKNAVTNANITF